MSYFASECSRVCLHGVMEPCVPPLATLLGVDTVVLAPKHGSTFPSLHHTAMQSMQTLQWIHWVSLLRTSRSRSSFAPLMVSTNVWSFHKLRAVSRRFAVSGMRSRDTTVASCKDGLRRVAYRNVGREWTRCDRNILFASGFKSPYNCEGRAVEAPQQRHLCFHHFIR